MGSFGVFECRENGRLSVASASDARNACHPCFDKIDVLLGVSGDGRPF